MQCASIEWHDSYVYSYILQRFTNLMCLHNTSYMANEPTQWSNLSPTHKYGCFDLAMKIHTMNT